MPDFDVSINKYQNDGFYRVTSEQFINSDYNRFEHESSRTNLWFCFESVPLSDRSTIDTARIDFKCWNEGPQTTPLSYRIYGELSPHASAPINVADYESRNKTNTFVDWAMPSWTIGVIYPTPDLSPIIQEILTLQGWQYGNSMQFFMEWLPTTPPYGPRWAESFERPTTGSTPPKLLVSFTEPSNKFSINNQDLDYVSRADWIEIPQGDYLGGRQVRSKHRSHIWQASVMPVSEFLHLQSYQGQKVSIRTINYYDRNGPKIEYYGAELRDMSGIQNSINMLNVEIEFRILV